MLRDIQLLIGSQKDLNLMMTVKIRFHNILNGQYMNLSFFFAGRGWKGM